MLQSMQYEPKETVSPHGKGLSLLEWVVAVGLVGIIAAFAVPRFTCLSNGARASGMTAFVSNLRRAAVAAHEQFVA